MNSKTNIVYICIHLSIYVDVSSCIMWFNSLWFYWLFSTCRFFDTIFFSGYKIVPNQSKNGEYNLISVWFDKIWKIFLRVHTAYLCGINMVGSSRYAIIFAWTSSTLHLSHKHVLCLYINICYVYKHILYLYT